MNPTTFVPYILARAFMSLSYSILSIALGWHIYEQTSDPFYLAMIGLVQIVPILSLFIVSGWVVDNFPRKTVLITCLFFETIALILLSFTMIQTNINITHAFGLLFVMGASRAFYSPVQQAILPNIVNKPFLAQGVAISTTVLNIASTFGPFIGGLLILWIDRSTYFVLGGLSFLSLLLFLFLPRLILTKPSSRGWSEVVAGIGFIKNNPLVLGSISIDLFAVMLGSVVVLLPVFAVDVLNVDADMLGLMRAMPALGAVMVGIYLTKYPLTNSGESLFICLVLFALSIFVFAFSKLLWLSLIALWVYGATDMISVNIRSTIIQLATPDALRGRVSAVNSIFIASSNNLGNFRAGVVATLVSPIATVAIGGAMAFGIAIGGYYLFPSIRSLKKLKDIQESK